MRYVHEKAENKNVFSERFKESNTPCKQIQPLSRIKKLALLGFFRRTGFCSPPYYCNWPHYPGARLLVYLPRHNGLYQIASGQAKAHVLRIYVDETSLNQQSVDAVTCQL